MSIKLVSITSGDFSITVPVSSILGMRCYTGGHDISIKGYEEYRIVLEEVEYSRVLNIWESWLESQDPGILQLQETVSTVDRFVQDQITVVSTLVSGTTEALTSLTKDLSVSMKSVMSLQDTLIKDSSRKLEDLFLPLCALQGKMERSSATLLKIATTYMDVLGVDEEGSKVDA